ncbi:bromodomain protein, partial [Gregarina niphandrodes]
MPGSFLSKGSRASMAAPTCISLSEGHILFMERKRRRRPLESNTSNPKTWPPLEHLYPIVVQGILEQQVFGANAVVQRIVESAKRAAALNVRMPAPAEAAAGAAARTDDGASGRSSSAGGDAAAGGDLAPDVPRAAFRGTVQVLADGALAGDQHGAGSSEETLEDPGADHLGRLGPYHMGRLGPTGGLGPSGGLGSSGHGAGSGGGRGEAATPPLEEGPSVEFVVPAERVRSRGSTAVEEPWEAGSWRAFEDAFDAPLECSAPVRRREAASQKPRVDALFWGTVAGGTEEVLGVEERYKAAVQVRPAEESFAAETLGWACRARSVVPGSVGMSRGEVSCLQYEALREAYNPQEPVLGPDDAFAAAFGRPGVGEGEGSGGGNEGGLGPSGDGSGAGSNPASGSDKSFLAQALDTIQEEVSERDAVETAMAILRHTLTEPAGGRRVYSVQKILDPAPPLLRSLVMDMNSVQVSAEDLAAKQVLPLHAYQTLLPLVARYVSRTEPPSAPGRAAPVPPPHKRIKKAPNEEPLPVKNPDAVNMLQLCKFITERLLRDYALWQTWGEILSTPGDTDLRRNHQKWSLITRMATAVASSPFAASRHEIVVWLQTHKHITDPLLHLVDGPTDPGSRHRPPHMLLPPGAMPPGGLPPGAMPPGALPQGGMAHGAVSSRALLGSPGLMPPHGAPGGAASLAGAEAMTEIALQWLTPIPDEVYLGMDPYKAINRGMGASRRDVAGGKAKALIHAPIAWSFPTAIPKSSAVTLVRHFRPDFRTGLYHAKYFQAEGVAYTLVHPSGVARSAFQKSKIAKARIETLSLPDTVDANTAGNSPLWGTWTVQYPRQSPALTEYNVRLSSSSAVHPSEVLVDVESLSIAEWCPLVVVEHATTPAMLPLPGMVAKMVRFYRPGKEPFASIAQTEAKLAGRLGPYGNLKILGDRPFYLFGCPMRIKPSHGTVIFKTSVYVGVCMVHPVDPRKPLPTPEQWRDKLFRSKRPKSVREGSRTLDHHLDYRLTDFLLVRTASYNANNPRIKVTLRPLYYGCQYETSDPRSQDVREQLREKYGVRERVAMAMDSFARMGVYVVGQHAPDAEIPSPDGKRINEWRKLWLEAYALRQANCGVPDMTANKTRCLKWFQGVFDNPGIQKILQPLKKTNAGETTISGLSTMTSNLVIGATVKIVAEEVIQKLITPEQICGIIAAQLGAAQLVFSGIRFLRHFDRLAVARSILQQRDFVCDAQWARAYAIWDKYLEHAKLPEDERDAGTTLFTLPPPFRGLHPGFTLQLGIVARVVEELLVFAPWNQWKAFQDVTAKKNAQFLLGSIFDHSLGRGEEVCFLKEDVGTAAARDSLIPVMTKFIPDSHRQLPITRYGVDPTRFVIFEEAKRNVIQETNSLALQTSLLRTGLSPNVIATMARSELVNCAYRCHFMINSRGSLPALQNQAGRLDPGDYNARINDIINRQRNTLQIDTVLEDPPRDLTDIFEEAAHPKLDQNDLEMSFLEDVGLPAVSSNANGSIGGNATGGSATGGSVIGGSVTGGNAAMMSIKGEEEDGRCTDQQLRDLVWSLESVMAPDTRLGAGPPLGLLYKEEADKFGKEIQKMRGSGDKFVFPATNPIVAAAMNAWLKKVPEGDVRTALERKEGAGVPCLRWVRRAPNLAGGPRVVNRDKVILIYGAKNITKFLKWRRDRLQLKFNKHSPTETSLAGSSVVKRGSSATTPKRPRVQLPRTDASIVKKIIGPTPRPTPSHDSRPGPAPAPAVGGVELTTQINVERPAQVSVERSTTVAAERTTTSRSKKAKADDGPDLGSDEPGIDENSLMSRETRGCLPVSSIRLTPRQQRLLQERFESGTDLTPVHFAGTPDQAAEELNNNLGRLVAGLKKPDKKFLWFWEKVQENDAPNYYSIIKTPMYLNLISQRCTQKI